jgi:hypothetical protein
MMKRIKLFSVFLLGLLISLSLSLLASAQPRADFYTDSGAYYDFYLDYMYPKRNVGPVPASADIKPLTTEVGPRTDFHTDSGAYYDFYLDWMYPKRNVGPVPTPADIKPLTAKPEPRTSFDGPGDSGAYYDFYLDWMSPRVKSKTPRVITILTRDASKIGAFSSK